MTAKDIFDVAVLWFAASFVIAWQTARITGDYDRVPADTFAWPVSVPFRACGAAWRARKGRGGV